MNQRILFLVGTAGILGTVVTVLCQASKGHAIINFQKISHDIWRHISGHAVHQESVIHTESTKSQMAEGTVPEAAKLLHAQLASIRRGRSDSPADEREVALHNSLGHVYHDSGNYAEAIRQYSFARDQAAQLGNSEQLVRAQTNLGSMYASAGRLQDAKRELESAFLLLDRSGPNAFTTMRAMANVRRDFGKLDEALVLYGETLNLQDRETHLEKVFPVEKVAGLLSDMGEAYHRKGQLDSALSHYQQALDKVTAASTSLPTSGSAAMELADIYNHIGQAKHEKGDLEQAEEYYRKALRVQQRAVRENHPCIVETLIHLARLKRDSGASTDSALADLAKAETLLRGREKHPEFARLLMLKADLLRKADRLTEAEAAAQGALWIQEDLGCEETPELAISLNILGMIQHDGQKYEDALKQYMRALKMNMKILGNKHPETATTYNNLGYLYQDTKNNAAAEKYYRKAAEIQRTIYTVETPDIAATYNNIATLLVGEGRFSEAEELLRKVVDIVQKAGMPPGSAERAIYEENLKDVQQKLAGTTRAEETHETQMV